MGWEVTFELELNDEKPAVRGPGRAASQAEAAATMKAVHRTWGGGCELIWTTARKGQTERSLQWGSE